MENKKRAADYECELPEKEWIDKESEKCEMTPENSGKAECIKSIESEKEKRAEACTEYVEQINKSGS